MISKFLFATSLNIMTNSWRCTVFSLGVSKVDQKRFFLQNGWTLPASEALGVKNGYPRELFMKFKVVHNCKLYDTCLAIISNLYVHAYLHDIAPGIVIEAQRSSRKTLISTNYKTLQFWLAIRDKTRRCTGYCLQSVSFIIHQDSDKHPFLCTSLHK